ncbi:hypothetical protein PAEPH01_0578 [Pancytospora epiphaga]|nr:hypothetical protein PAEPH01_0578 [Pancytospora epiphaga]
MATGVEEYKFTALENLLSVMKSEKSYQIQIFSLESVEVFEKALSTANIKYVKSFTSAYVTKKAVVLLLKDSPLGDISLSSRILYYANLRDSRFVPYKFKITPAEKCRLAGESEASRLHKNTPFTFLSKLKSKITCYGATSFNYVQSVILFCMIREKTFSKLCKEICSVDERLKNKFLIHCELNKLLKLRICKRNGDSYTINLSLETQDKICEALGFKHTSLN